MYSFSLRKCENKMYDNSEYRVMNNIVSARKERIEGRPHPNAVMLLKDVRSSSLSVVHLAVPCNTKIFNICEYEISSYTASIHAHRSGSLLKANHMLTVPGPTFGKCFINLSTYFFWCHSANKQT